MYIDPKRCLQCGSRVRHTFAEEDIRDLMLSTDGTFSETNFWFCTIDCYKKCVGKYLDPRFHFDKTATDDPEYQKQMGIWYDEFEKKRGVLYSIFHPSFTSKGFWEPREKQLREEWEEWQKVAITRAENDVLKYIVAEVQHQNEVDDEKKHEELLKQHQAIDKEYDKLLQQAGKDEEKHMAEFDKLQRQVERDEEEMKAREELLREKPIPFEYRFDHTHILGSSGQGKSSLIIDQYLKDINEPRHPAIVILDPKGTLVDQLRKIDYIEFKQDHVPRRSFLWGINPVIIDPTLFPAALNMFAPPKREYPPEIAQQLENNAISLLQYVFSSKGSALTDKQMTCFSYAIALVLKIPGATIHTFLDLMNDDPISKIGGMRPDSPFKPFIDQLGPTAKRFFYDSFYDIAEYGGTKDQCSAFPHSTQCSQRPRIGSICLTIYKSARTG